MVLVALLAAAAGLALAPLYAVVRDTQHVVTAVWTVLFFASPVLYRVDALPARLSGLAELNPMTAIIGLYRAGVLGLPVGSPISFVVCFSRSGQPGLSGICSCDDSRERSTSTFDSSSQDRDEGLVDLPIAGSGAVVRYHDGVGLRELVTEEGAGGALQRDAWAASGPIGAHGPFRVERPVQRSSD
jgi:hypothetical protein